MSAAKTLGQVLYEALKEACEHLPAREMLFDIRDGVHFWECADTKHAQAAAAAVVAAYEAAQVMTWDEAMAWSLEQRSEPLGKPGYLLAYSAGLGRWFMVQAGSAPFDSDCFITGPGGVRFVPPVREGERAALTAFRKMPPAPESAR